MTDTIRLETRSVEKVWGRHPLPAPFAQGSEEPIGEIWFEPADAMPDLLVKYLFTSEKLSVQVHPRDGEAGPGLAGKDECWLVLDAQGDARLAIGFRESVNEETMRAAALDGSIEHLLEWHRAKPGDFFYLPAGTVHAIGAGLTLVEVQQNTDITYRLYDYGRPRELHLDQGLAVASGEPYPEEYRRTVSRDVATCLVDGPYFRLDQCVGGPDADLRTAYPGACQILPLDEPVQVGGVQVEPGESVLASQLGDVVFPPTGRTLVTRTTG